MWLELDILVKGGIILTMDERDSIFHPGDLWVKDGKILSIRKSSEENLPVEAKKIIDAKGCLVLPGLINSHTHLPMVLLRGYSDDLPLKEWLFDRIFPAEAQLMNPRSVYWATLWGCVELIKSGITCVMDGYFFEEEVAAALSRAGIRGVLGQGVLDYPTPDTPEPEENLKRAREFVEETLNRYPLITPSIFCHSPLTVKKETIVKAKELCSEYGIPLQMHVSETEEEFRQILYQEGLTPVSYLDSLGVLDPEFVSVHLVHITDGDLQTLSQRGVRVVHCPESNMKLSSGVARVHEMLQRGLVVGIGTDSVCSNNNMDLFREIDMATKLQKAVFGDATLLNARDGLRMGTSLGATTVGMGDRIGSLSEGKEADFIVVDLDRPHLFPIYDPYSLCVYSLKGSDVRDVIISGRVIMENKRVLTIDVEEARAKVGEIVRNIRTDWFHLEGEG